MHVSNWRRASSSSSVNDGATGMGIAFRSLICKHRCNFVCPGFQQSCTTRGSRYWPALLTCLSKSRFPSRTGPAACRRKIQSERSAYQVDRLGLAAKVLRRETQRMEVVDRRGSVQEEDFAREVPQAQCGDKNWEIVRDRNKPAEAPSWPHPCRDAAVSPPALCALARSSPWAPKHSTKRNNASPRSQSASIRQPKRPPRTKSCVVDLRNVLAVTSQEQFPIQSSVAYKIQPLQ